MRPLLPAMFAHLRLIAVCALALSAGGALPAKVFKLTNGDRVSGELVATDENAIVVETPLLGRVRIPRAALAEPLPAEVAAVIPGPEPSPPAPPGPPPAPPAPRPEPPALADASIEPPEEGPLPDSDPEQRRLRLQDLPADAYRAWIDFWEDNVVFRSLAKVYPLMDWKNKLTIGIHLQDAEKDQQTLSFGYVTEKQQGKHSARLQLNYDYSESTLTTSTFDSEGNPIKLRTTTATMDKTFGNARYRYEYVKSFFAQSDTRYQRALVKRIYHEIDELCGVGYTYLKTETLEASVTPSFGFGYRDYASDPPAWEWLVSFQQDFSVALSERVKFSEESTLTYSPFKDKNFSFYFKSVLENQLNKRISLRVTYELDYTERIDTDIERTSQSVKFALAANF